MIIECLNFVACLLTIWGTWEVAKPNANTLKVNRIYLIGSILMVIVFVAVQNGYMVGMYLILAGFSVKGIWGKNNDF